MRSNLMTLATVVAGVLLAMPVAAADEAVQEQLRLMEQRMAEMEDRLQATSEELQTAKATAREQKELLSDAGLIEADENATRSGASSFFEMIEVSGVVAASYNYRFIDGGDNDSLGDTTGLGGGANGGASNDTFFTQGNADTFQIDQVWMTVEKAPTEESRGGFHIDYVWGETAQVQSGFGSPTGNGGGDSGLIYTAYASYLAPIGSGVQIDAGKLATTLGAEVLQSNANFNISNGVVFQNLQPFTHTGVTASTEIADGVGLVVGVVNEVYRDTNVSVDRDKAGIAQLQFAGDSWGLNVGAIVGQDPTAGRCVNSSDDCNTSVFDVTATIDPTDNFSAWVNFDWARTFGKDVSEGDKYGIATAARLGVTDDTGISGRFEYLKLDESTNGAPGAPGNDDVELITVTGTLDHTLAEGLVVRGELRWDRFIEDAIADFSSGDDDQLTGLVEMQYSF